MRVCHIFNDKNDFFNGYLCVLVLLNGENFGWNKCGQEKWTRGTRENGLGGNNSIRPTNTDRFDY